VDERSPWMPRIGTVRDHALPHGAAVGPRGDAHPAVWRDRLRRAARSVRRCSREGEGEPLEELVVPGARLACVRGHGGTERAKAPRTNLVSGTASEARG